MNLNKILLFLSLIITSFTAFSEGVYRWTDASGQIHYGDQSIDPAAEEMNVIPGKPDQQTINRLQRQQTFVQNSQQRREQEREQAAKAQIEKKQKAANCMVAKSRLLRTQRARYLYDYNSNGERRFYSDSERKESEKRAQLRVKKACT